MNCPKCTEETTRTVGNYHLTECGLDNVWLEEWPMVNCPKCEVSKPVLPDPAILEKLLIEAIVCHETRLDGDSILFLRRSMGLTAIALAEILRTSRAEISRWENDRVEISPYLDFRLRMEATRRLLPDRVRDTQLEIADVLSTDRYQPQAEERPIRIPLSMAATAG